MNLSLRLYLIESNLNLYWTLKVGNNIIWTPEHKMLNSELWTQRCWCLKCPPCSKFVVGSCNEIWHKGCHPWCVACSLNIQHWHDVGNRFHDVLWQHQKAVVYILDELVIQSRTVCWKRSYWAGTRNIKLSNNITLKKTN